jgi:hypothetical protein
VNTPSFNLESPSLPLGASIQQQVDFYISDLLGSLPDPKTLTSEQRRGIIARYTAVLEGNFIYWMTGALLAVRSQEARAIIMDNLHEEVRDSHPAMMRRFAIAAAAFPTDSDSLAVHRDLTNVRLFVGKLSGVPVIITMAFFEGFIQKFMASLAELARLQGSVEMEYTDVHGVCDIAHTEGLFRALDVEMSVNPPSPATNLFEGVELLSGLIRTIVHFDARENSFKAFAALPQHGIAAD